VLGVRHLVRGRVHWARKGCNLWRSLVASVVDGFLDVVDGVEGRRRQWCRNSSLGGSEGRAPVDHVADLGDGGPLGRVELKNALENGIELQGDGKNGPQEVGVLHESTEGAVLGRSTLPRVASAGEVDKNDTKAPHVIGGRSVARVGLWCRRLAFR